MYNNKKKLWMVKIKRKKLKAMVNEVLHYIYYTIVLACMYVHPPAITQCICAWYLTGYVRGKRVCELKT